MSNCHALTQPARRAFTQRLTGLIVQSLTLQRSRYSLADLEPHLLADIGLTSEQALREAARPVWDAPDGRQKRN